MARRWKVGMLLGVLWAGLCPLAVCAQNTTDPVPLATASPMGPGTGAPMPMPTAAPPPFAGYAPGMGGPGLPPPSLQPGAGGSSGCGPGCGHGLLSGCFTPTGELDDDCWHFYANGGWVGLIRWPMKDHVLAVEDTVGFDDGLPPDPNSRVIFSFADVKPDLASGGRLNIGLYADSLCFEVGGMFIPKRRDTASRTLVGSISSFFTNPPLGFEGTNPDLWDNADIMSLTLQDTLASGEFNVRYFLKGDDVAAEMFVGLLYVELQEELEIFTDDDSLQFAPDPLSVATYGSRVRNHMLGVHAGASMHGWLCDWLALSWDVSGAWLANYANMEIDLVRGDGFVGIDDGDNKWGFTQIYQGGVFVDLTCSRCRVRLGYQGMVFWHLATAQDQVDFNLENHNGRGDMQGTIFFHGPTAQLEFVF